MTIHDARAYPKCPKCNASAKRTNRNSGYLQTKLLPMLGLYPWECLGCRAIFMAKNRGPHKKRIADTSNPIEGTDSAA